MSKPIKSKSFCFIIMPFGVKKDDSGEEVNFDMIYEHIIRQPIEEDLKINCIRSDKISQSGSIHKDMIESIVFARIAIVDISLLNPNVFYELGVRHALRKNITVIIRKKGTTIPFNLQGMRVIDYGTQIDDAKDAANKIRKAIEAGTKSTSSDSRVFDVFPHLNVTL